MKSLLKKLNQRNVSFNPLYRELTGSLAGGILLSQLMYWFTKKDKIFKVDKEIMKETSLTVNELRSAKKLLKKLDFIRVTKEGIPAKTYYEIDWVVFENSLNRDSENHEASLVKSTTTVSLNSLNCDSENHETIYSTTKLHTESTTESTTENTPESVRKNTPTTPFDIITFYRENISNLQDKIKEQKSYNILALKSDELEQILRGVKNYSLTLKAKETEKRYIKSLQNFLEDKTYLDYQKDVQPANEWTNYGKDYDYEKEWK